MKSARDVLPTLVKAFALLATLGWQPSAHAQAILGKKVTIETAYDYPFCEIWPITGDSVETAVGQVYNTTGASDCPPDKFDKIDAKALASELKVSRVWLNPRRHWTMNKLTVNSVGATEDFDGVKATWMATMDLKVLEAGLKGSYTPLIIHRSSQYVYNKGTTVYLMQPPTKDVVWVMQAYKDGTIAQLADNLGVQLKLPEGWTWKAMKLDRELTITPTGTAHIIQDNISNTYEGCGFDDVCNFTPHF